MASIAKVLKDEIQRLARKEAKAGAKLANRQIQILKKSIQSLKKELAQIKKQKNASPAAGVSARPSTAADATAAIRPTAKSIKSLRKKFGMTQIEFAKLLGISMQSVTNWETQSGRLKLRSKPLAALAEVQGMGKREAQTRLAAILGVPAESLKKKRGRKKTAAKKKTTRKATKKAKKKTSKKKAAKKKTTKKKATRKKTSKKAAKKTGKKTAKKTARKQTAKKKSAAKGKSSRKTKTKK